MGGPLDVFLGISEFHGHCPSSNYKGGLIVMQQKEGRKNWFVFYFVVLICNATEIRKNWAVLYYEL